MTDLLWCATLKSRTRPKKAQPAASENEYGQLTLF